jgi:hypothetical protein
MSDCIYYGALADSLEHPLPAVLGEFVNAPQLENRICKPCNNTRLGVLDEQLSRCGPEGFFRKVYGIRGRKGHDKVNPFSRGSAGGQRIEVAAWDRETGVEVNLELENGIARQISEVLLVDKSASKTHHIPPTSLW